MGSKAMRATEGTGRRWPPSLFADLEFGVLTGGERALGNRLGEK